MKSHIVPVGSTAPPFTLPDIDGVIRHLDDIAGTKTLLVFFRGFWCESCQAQLDVMRTDHQEVVDRGAVSIGISADSVERSRIGVAAAELPFLILCDPTLEAITRYGVLHRPDDAGPGIARPSVFVLDRTRTVRFAHVGMDPSDRPKLDALLLALDSIE